MLTVYNVTVLVLGLNIHSRGDVECFALSKHTNPCTRGELKFCAV